MSRDTYKAVNKTTGETDFLSASSTAQAIIGAISMWGKDAQFTVDLASPAEVNALINGHSLPLSEEE